MKSGHGGDVWIWANKFRRCVAGRHPWIGSSTQRNSQSMYYVLTTFYRSELHYWPQEEVCLAVDRKVLPTNYPEVPLIKDERPGNVRWEKQVREYSSHFSETRTKVAGLNFSETNEIGGLQDIAQLEDVGCRLP